MNNTLRITKDVLPLPPKLVGEFREICLSQPGRFMIARGYVPDDLRHDHLLGYSTKHHEISASAWRHSLEQVSGVVAKKAIDIFKKENISENKMAVIELWRAGLGLLPSYYNFGIRNHVHFGLRRNENEPHKTAEVYLPLNKEKLDNCTGFIIADVMLATGGSGITIIDQLISLGIPQEKIILASIISAPEGVFTLLDLYPGIRIITASLDKNLNCLAYIVPGLGDAGDKFFCGLTMDYFKPYRDVFSDKEWFILISLIRKANP